MPPLNWPFISQHLKLKAEGWQFTKHRAHFYSRLATHKRLFRKLRRRQQTIREPYLFTSTKHQALTLLRNLTKHTLASFEAAKQLRSGRHTDLEVYAIRRMASNLEEPGRSRALRIINKALHYRNLTPPKPNIPLTIPFLAHDDFTKHCQQWLQTTIQQRKHLAIPLHLPTHRLREAATKHSEHSFTTIALGKIPCAHLQILMTCRVLAPILRLFSTNDDLVGFFNSVPQHRLIDAVHSVIQQWHAKTLHTL